MTPRTRTVVGRGVLAALAAVYAVWRWMPAG